MACHANGTCLFDWAVTVPRGNGHPACSSVETPLKPPRRHTTQSHMIHTIPEGRGKKRLALGSPTRILLISALILGVQPF